MNRQIRRIQITIYDTFTLSVKERQVYNAIFQKTILENKRCTQLSLSDLSKLTGLGRNTINYQLDLLKKRRLIEIDNTQKTNTICIITTYKERFRI